MGTVLVRRAVASWRHQVSFSRRLSAVPLAIADKAGLERAFLTGGVFHFLDPPGLTRHPTRAGPIQLEPTGRTLFTCLRICRWPAL
jgi:hypothetical protein